MQKIANHVKAVFDKFGSTREPSQVNTAVAAPGNLPLLDLKEQRETFSLLRNGKLESRAALESKASPQVYGVPSIKLEKQKKDVKEYKLSNGLKILLKKDESVPLISFRTVYKAGSQNDFDGKCGLAHLVEHLAFNGGETFHKGEIDEAIRVNGGFFNAMTTKEATTYFGRLPPEHSELALKILADIMAGLKFEPKEIEREQAIVTREIKGFDNKPGYRLDNKLQAVALQGHPMARPTGGIKEEVAAISRDDIKEFYDTYYQPDNATLVITGNFDEEDLLEQIKQHFGKIAPGTKPRPQLQIPKSQEKEQSFLIEDDSKVKMLFMAYHIPHYDHEDIPVLKLIEGAMFDGKNSRMAKKLIEKAGAVQHVWANPSYGRKFGLFEIGAMGSNDYTDLNRVAQEIQLELDDIKKNGLTDEEFKQEISAFEAGEIYDKDGVNGQAASLAHLDALGSWEDYFDNLGKVKAVTNEDIKRVAAKYFRPENKTQGIIAPEAKTAKESENKDLVAESVAGSEASTESHSRKSAEKFTNEKLERVLRLSQPSPGSKRRQIKINYDLEKKEFGDNNLIALKEDHSLPLVYLNIGTRGGKLADPPDKPMLAQITAYMMNAGTKKLDKFKISKLCTELGAGIMVNSGTENFSIRTEFLSKNYAPVMRILKETLYEPEFDVEEFEKIKNSLACTVDFEDENQQVTVGRELNKLIYPEGHALRVPEKSIRKKLIRSITLDDVKKFYRENFGPRNLKISVVGDISMDDLLTKNINSGEKDSENKELKPESFASILSNWNKDTLGTEGFKVRVPEKVDKSKAEEKQITNKGKKEAIIGMAHAGDVSIHDPDYYPLAIANYILGASGLSSRLGREIREEEALVYKINSSYMGHIDGPGPFVINCECAPEKVEEVKSKIKAVLKEFLDKGITEAELTAAKAHITGSYASDNFSSRERRAISAMGLFLAGRDEEFMKNFRTMIYDKKIDTKRVMEVARKYIQPDKLHVVVSGPKPGKEDAKNS